MMTEIPTMSRRTLLAGGAAILGLLAAGRGVAGAAGTIGSSFVPVAPTRVADTRSYFGCSPAGRLPADATVTVGITGRAEVNVPATATAVVLNVIAVGASSSGFLTVYPAGIVRPTSSNVNFTAGDTRANAATVKLGAGGAIAVYSSASADVVVDVVGYYQAETGPVAAGRMVLGGPTRAYDSRGGAGKVRAGESRRIPLAGLVPAGSSAAVVNITVTGSDGGFFSALPAPAAGVPSTSTVNASAGATVANSTIVPLSTGLEMWVYASHGGHVIVDVFGYVSGAGAQVSSAGLFVPLSSPFRMLDTRSASPLGNGMRMWPGWSVEAAMLGRGGVPTSGVSGVVGNITYVDAHDAGFLVAYQAGFGRPSTSSVNTDNGGDTVANHMLCGISSRGLAVFSSAGGHAIVDVSGYLTGTATVLPAVTAAKQYAPPPVWPVTLTIPRLGHSFQVYGSSEPAVIDTGNIGWFPGTGYPGGLGEMVVFGHRTAHGGPFRYINQLVPGDRITVTGDRRTGVYEVYDIDAGDSFSGFQVIPASAVSDVVAMSGSRSEGIALVACTLPNGQPTSLDYRIVVHARLISYTNS